MRYGDAVVIDGGEIKLNNVIDGGELGVNIRIDGREFGVFYDSGGTAAPVYTGPYEVDPRFENITLSTSGKLMKHDVIVHEIYVGRVTNPSGGKTVTIGG